MTASVNAFIQQLQNPLVKPIIAQTVQSGLGLIDDISLMVRYEHNRDVSIITGVAAVIAAIAAIVFSTFLPLSAVTTLGSFLAAGALVGLAITSIFHAVKALKGEELIDDPTKLFDRIPMNLISLFGAQLNEEAEAAQLNEEAQAD